MNTDNRRLALVLVLLVTPLIFTLHPRSMAGAQVARAFTPAPDYVAVMSFLESRRIRLVDTEIDQLAHTILSEARRAEIEPRLILGLIQVESSGNPRAVSKVGALGLMQLRPRTAAAMARESAIPWEGPESLFEPNLNVQLGVRYLTVLIDRFGDIDIALAAYNWGPTRIARVIRSGRSVPVRYTESVHRAHTALI
ncbi:MAG: lytic transglycosylase domain-containing protein [Deltaproteobacteria bacterium]|nr:lytic transglycosylase domain-containing protein [Deltaproteobacteria bacterium]